MLSLCTIYNVVATYNRSGIYFIVKESPRTMAFVIKSVFSILVPTTHTLLTSELGNGQLPRNPNPQLRKLFSIAQHFVLIDDIKILKMRESPPAAE